MSPCAKEGGSIQVTTGTMAPDRERLYFCRIYLFLMNEANLKREQYRECFGEEVTRIMLIQETAPAMWTGEECAA